MLREETAAVVAAAVCWTRIVRSLLLLPLIFTYLQMKLVTLAAMSERLKIGGSLARAGLRELVQKGLLRVVAYHSKAAVYTRATNVD